MKNKNIINLLIGLPNTFREIPIGKTIITDGSQKRIDDFIENNCCNNIIFRNVVFDNVSNFRDIKKVDKENYKKPTLNVSINWNIYNDKRLDGFFDKKLIANNYPNSRITSKINLETLTIYQFINSEREFINEDTLINIYIRQGIPKNILEGAKSKFNQINKIFIDLPLGLSRYIYDAKDYLINNGFKNQYGEENTWKMDETNNLKRELKKLKKNISELEKKSKLKEEEYLSEIKNLKEKIF